MINKTSLLAIKALVELAKVPKGQCLGAAEIAQRIHAPRNYLGKLLQTLANRDLVRSQRGLHGGFSLARDSAKIKLFDIAEEIEHVGRFESCFLGKSRCSDASPCAAHEKWKKARDPYIRFLRETSVEDLV